MTNTIGRRLTSGKRINVAARLCSAVTASGCIVAAPATAQSYANQPIKVIIPFTAGGGTDVAARLVAEYLGAASRRDDCSGRTPRRQCRSRAPVKAALQAEVDKWRPVVEAASITF